MRCTILKDTKITTDEVNELQRQFDDIVDHFDVQYFVHDRDYVFYPTFTDSDGDKRPTDAFLKDETDFVFKKYGLWGTDHVFILIHEDNWQSPTIWGTNFSNIYHGYQVHYCRFDRDNPANSLGTFYHEWMHSLDALCQVETGINVASLLGVSNWDSDIVHGGKYPYKYIRYRENIEVVDYIEKYLKQSYANRKGRFEKQVSLFKQIISLLSTMLVLLRQQMNKKNGVDKLLAPK